MMYSKAVGAFAAAALAGGALLAPLAGAQSTSQTTATAANESGNPINAPETVDPGQQVTVSVAGGDGGHLEIWGPVGEGGGGQQVASVPLSGGTALVTAPQVAASYELRYVAADGSRRASRAFEVAASPVMLRVPTNVESGATLSVTWRGPAKPGDMLQIHDPATGMTLQSTPVAGDPGAQNVSALTVPDHVGPAELRYVALNGAVLRTVPFEIR